MHNYKALWVLNIKTNLNIKLQKYFLQYFLQYFRQYVYSRENRVLHSWNLKMNSDIDLINYFSYY